MTCAKNEGSGERHPFGRRPVDHAYQVFLRIVLLGIDARSVEHAQAVVESLSSITVWQEVACQHDAGVAPHGVAHQRVGRNGRLIQCGLVHLNVAQQGGGNEVLQHERLLELAYPKFQFRHEVVLSVILMQVFFAVCCGHICHQEEAQPLGQLRMCHEDDAVDGHFVGALAIDIFGAEGGLSIAH